MASHMLDVAESYLNTPYRRGGTSPQSGFDAAGFVRSVIGRAQVELGQKGAELPRTARDLAKMGDQVPLRIGSVRPGDLLFFASDGRHIDHVAIYAGRDRIIHATASGGGVRYDILSEGERGRWFAEHLVSARRLVGARISKTGDAGRDERFDPPDPAPQPTH
ncbi:MAG TPA: C40 family peptidase [Gemmatimonadales bacterium]|nr:C40 family peptidase [Gemmatimonadales bacterium]